jgi:predicted transcriptional regulator
VRDGQRLIERDHATRVSLEAGAIVEYLDTEPLRAELARGLRHRIEEGRFGRRIER